MDASVQNNKRVTVFYCQHYLASSMTFIYNQLLSVLQKYNCVVISTFITENVDKFPHKKLFSIEKNRFVKKFLMFWGKLTQKDSYYYFNIAPFLTLRQRKKIKNILIAKKVNLIHAHFGPSGIEICSLAEELNIPLIVTFHGYDATALIKNKVYKQNLRNLFNYANIICVSDFMKQQLVQIGAISEKISVIRYGTAIDKFSFCKRESLASKKLKNSKVVFLQVSTFVEKKGHRFTILAFKKFLEYYPNAELILGGDGYLFEEIKKFSKEADVPNIKFTGFINHNSITELMKKADVFLHHSITAEDGNQEGIPNAIMEAMATGLPVISTWHAGIPEIIKDGYNGYLVKEKDVDEYVIKLKKIMDDDGSLGILARQTIEEEFNLKFQEQKLINNYNSILKSSPYAVN